jgi:tetratricopeptide (TPR) repeat protein
MSLFESGADFSRYLRTQFLLLFITIPLGVILTLSQHSLWYLFIPIASLPFGHLLYLALGTTGEGAVDILFGMGRGQQIYSESLLFDADMEKANVVRRDGYFPEALLMYEKIAERAPDRAEPLFEMANTHRQAGDREKARAIYIKVAVKFGNSLGSEHYIIRESITRARELASRDKKSVPTEDLPA